MNFVTSERAVSLFPYTTLIARKWFTTVSKRHRNRDLKDWAAKYVSRGFEIIDAEYHQVHKELGLGDRQLMDWQSWVVEFTPVGEFPDLGCLVF